MIKTRIPRKAAGSEDAASDTPPRAVSPQVAFDVSDVENGDTTLAKVASGMPPGGDKSVTRREPSQAGLVRAAGAG
jgi:hypothetical protein